MRCVITPRLLSAFILLHSAFVPPANVERPTAATHCLAPRVALHLAQSPSAVADCGCEIGARVAARSFRYPESMGTLTLIHPASLSETVDAVSEAIAAGRKLAARDRSQVACWIASRQGLPGAYADTFAGFGEELRRGIRLFTGERVTSASARHILGQETCRALRQLDVRDRVVVQALGRATAGLLKRLAQSAAHPRHINAGVFCCGKCTVGLWRHLAAGGLDRQEERLRKGIQHVRSMRDGKGGWQKFPFWCTMLLLAEVDVPGAKAEIRYAAPGLERVASRSPTDRFARRRREIAVRALAFV